MDIFEKLNKAFTGWYESLFGDAVSDIRPKDVLRKIVNAMEDNRKEGLDNRIYVPNKYILEISFASDEEREYLLAFLEKEELENALRKYMSQNKYHIRGPLDFTIEEVTPVEGGEQREKLRVKCKWEVGPIEVEPEPMPERQSRSPYVIPELADPGASSRSYEDEEEYTVAGTDVYDASTVAPPILRIKRPDGTSEQFFLTKPVTLIGRSRRLNNDLVIDNDGMISKRHAKIILGTDGFRVIDLDSTNGTWVNDEKISTASLRNGDVIRLGATELVFEEAGVPAPVRAARIQSDIPKPRLLIDRGGRSEEFRLPSEMVIGKALTSDVRFEHPTVAQRHARVFSAEGGDFYIEDLGSVSGTRVNGIEVMRNSPVRLRNGDSIQVGEVTLRYAMD